MIYNVTVINSQIVLDYYNGNGAEGVEFYNINDDELQTLCNLAKRHCYTLIMTVVDKEV